MGKLDGKVAVITAGSSGMALETAKLYVKEGAYVFITGRNQDRLDTAVKEIGSNATGVRADSSKLEDLDRLFATVKAEKGRIDVLFASAGVGELKGLEEVDEAHYDWTFNTNVRGTLFTVQKAIPLLTDGASVILNGSIANAKAFPRFSVYAGSKGAIRAFVRAWLVEYKERCIRFNVLSPGSIDTPALTPLGDAEFLKTLAAMIPRGTLGTPGEIASAALFLGSSDSSFVNGVELFVDGGTVAI